jgi:hypothetical protein
MWLKRKTAEKELSAAERSVAASLARAQAELTISTQRLRESRRVARTIRAHNDANHYGSLLEGPQE